MTETNPPNRLPDADKAIVPRDKLKSYSLSADHGRGKDKARCFNSALGITDSDWKFLRDQIIERIGKSDVRRIEPRGGWSLWLVDVWIDGLNGERHLVATLWTVQPHQPPRLTSIWVDI